MITADTLTDKQIAARVKEALARFERGADTPNDREFIRLYKTATFPHVAMSMLSAEDHAEVTTIRARLAEIINDGC
jgi:hypothetical protein